VPENLTPKDDASRRWFWVRRDTDWNIATYDPKRGLMWIADFEDGGFKPSSDDLMFELTPPPTTST
jgi:hypothetical protein